MERDVQAVAERIEAAFNAGPDAYAEIHTEDVVHETAPEWPEAGTYRGRDAVRRLWTQIFEVHESVTSQTEEVIQVDEDTFLARMRLDTRGLASGTSSTTTVLVLTHLRGDLIERVAYFLTEAEAREAAGLEPRA